MFVCVCSVPAKGPVGVDDAQRIKGGVHHLPGAQQVGHHRDAEEPDQNAQSNVHQPPYEHPCVTNSIQHRSVPYVEGLVDYSGWTQVV